MMKDRLWLKGCQLIFRIFTKLREKFCQFPSGREFPKNKALVQKPTIQRKRRSARIRKVKIKVKNLVHVFSIG